MNLEEAIEKYGIKVPTDAEFYSEGYDDYFAKNKRTEELSEKFSKYEEFHNMYLKSFYITFHKAHKEIQNKKRSIANSEAVVLGGQAGAGKGGLAIVAKQEFWSQGKEIVLIDDDEYRKCYPKEKREGMLRECPEYYTKITAIGSSSITPKIMKYASDHGFNFIFDGTMKNPRIIQTAMNWDNYNINWKVMATSKLESLLSVFERNDILRQQGDCRFMTVDVHNETYSGLATTLMNLESLGNMGKIQVYTRGEAPERPRLVYDSFELNQKYKTAVSALMGAREENRKICIMNGVEQRIHNLKNANISRNEAELEALLELEQRLKGEIEIEKER